MEEIKKAIILIITALALLMATSISLAQPRASRPMLDLSPLQKYSIWTSAAIEPLPSIEAALKAMEVLSYEDVIDGNGILGAEASPLMKPCCVPGSTGTEEHLLKLYLLEGKNDNQRKMSGLILEITGYCTLEDVAVDMATTVMRAESLRDSLPNMALLKDRIMKALSVAHYRWYMAGARAPQYMAVSHMSGLDFTLYVEPENQKLKLFWPALLPGSVPMQDSIKSFEEYLADDRLGMEAILTTNYNAFALSCLEAEATPQVDSSGST